MNLVLVLPLALLFGFLAYREAAKHRVKHGAPPWNLSPEVWGVIVFLTGVLGIFLLWVAMRADGKRNAEPQQVVVGHGRGRAGSVL